ncbi:MULTISPECIES: NAD-dependent succinate-semialdehyde dehydrogenase [unclassified Marinobacter]|uniref:NAD-dependent succinate-semialdehyde dehydrogenase n=1 Tax=unclassified Marinobacter TaxID=83889 RepID=UPI000BF74185|nr:MULTISPECIES: NAD-dependent succinate-semialdehyde dehydrogenase [unclassified Marinobacter]PFG11664.1 succinate-semialdehyde dehydrogenase/glutarate-semialdehyde dehydrogenase [Marinobacter sp. LV10MA510-1]PFG53486.1 succinate-semialdehyde dehydrogenase/glutarate-semialdehyde dehydrogenase [Marinobacter sp. LV10R520-4]
MSDSNQTINPATEEVIETYSLISREEAEGIVDQCHEAFLDWRKTRLQDRANVLRKTAELIRERKNDYAALMTREMGKTLADGKQECDLCAAICEYTADQGAQVLADETRDIDGGRGLVTYQPQGVIYGIQPWNFPLYQVIRYSAANLMAGNTVLLKHAANVWGMALEVEQLYRDAGLPQNAFRTLLISHDVSDAMIEHKRVRGVTFTGSPGAGRVVAEKAGKVLKKTVMELGSNDAYLVLADANIEKAVKFCVQGRVNNAGQTCVAAKRFIVEGAVYDQFRDAYVAAMKNITFGDPTDPKTDIGPMARKDLRDGLHDQVRQSIDAGATCLLGGEIPEGKGYYYPPTVLENVTPGQPAYDAELFGPVAALIRVKDKAEAIEVANDSVYGLGGGIFSTDEAEATRIARDEMDTGMVNINGYNIALPNMPFGGVKGSGYGREQGGFGMLEFVNVKGVMINDG